MITASSFAQKYLEDLLSFFGLNTSVEVEESDDRLTLQVPSSHLNGFLIGAHGDNLRSLQYLTNMSLRAAGYEDTQVMVDIAGYRQQRNERLTKQADQLAQQVLQSGKELAMEPMSAFERRIVHQAIGEIDGVTSASSGEGRDRHVVIQPTKEGDST